MLIKLHSQATTTPKIQAAMSLPGFLQSATGRQSKLFGSGASAIALKIEAIRLIDFKPH